MSKTFKGVSEWKEANVWEMDENAPRGASKYSAVAPTGVANERRGSGGVAGEAWGMETMANAGWGD